MAAHRGQSIRASGNEAGAAALDDVDEMVLRRMKDDVTIHGFRSTFRDRASERTGFSQEVCEFALAHTIGNKVEAAYRRGDMVERRRELSEAWK